MKNLLYIFALAVFFLNSCIENDDIVYEKAVVEFDAATYNAKSVVDGVAKNYTLLTRVPAYGAAVTTSRPAITRASGAIRLRVNLVGAQRSTAQEINYKLLTSETTAVAGTHYAPLSGKVTIPANSSFGELEIQILDPGVSSATPVDLVLELDGNEEIGPNENYRRIGVRISQL
ncbi:DUF4843 domain-containing protein [Sabulibacter ruber]|uniref:DUF4843 domain-containing protein n=1 Tax=Sabulibacter ruber TaxID=2811901 RepID=UPI001A9788B5|nr:DUF4843 domain-containing protein [Sabulibacter ruber]